MTRLTKDGKVIFEFHRLAASQVQVRVSPCAFLHGVQQTVIDEGPVNAQMERNGDGHWSITLRLAAGEYRFQYLADGVEYTDFAGFGVEYRNGKWIGLLSVPEPTAGHPLKLLPSPEVRLAA